MIKLTTVSPRPSVQAIWRAIWMGWRSDPLWWRIVGAILSFLMIGPAISLSIYYHFSEQAPPKEPSLLHACSFLALIGSTVWLGPTFRGLRQLWDSGSQRNLPRLRTTIRSAQLAIVVSSLVLTCTVVAHSPISALTASVVTLAVISYATLMGTGRTMIALIPLVLAFSTVLSSALVGARPDVLHYMAAKPIISIVTIVFSVLSLLHFLPSPSVSTASAVKQPAGAPRWTLLVRPLRPRLDGSVSPDKVSLQQRLRLGLWQPSTDRWCSIRDLFVTSAFYTAVMGCMIYLRPAGSDLAKSLLVGLLFLSSGTLLCAHLIAQRRLRHALHRFSLMPAWQSTQTFLARTQRNILADLMTLFGFQTLVLTAVLWIIGTERGLTLQLIALLWLSNLAGTTLLLLLLRLHSLRVGHQYLLMLMAGPASAVAVLSVYGAVTILPQVNWCYAIITIGIGLWLLLGRHLPNLATHQ